MPAPPPGYPQSHAPSTIGAPLDPPVDSPEPVPAKPAKTSGSRTSLVVAFCLAVLVSAGVIAWLVVSQVAPESPEAVVAPVRDTDGSAAPSSQEAAADDRASGDDDAADSSTDTVVIEATTSSSEPPVEPPTTPVTEVPTGDLGLPTVMSNPACDGRWITIVGSAVDASTYAETVAGFLRGNPGANYLRTSTTNCSSLRTYFDDGSEIYAAYYGPFEDLEDACDLVVGLGGGAYAKPLDNVTDSSYYLTSADC